jgi:hypothetical protein
MPYGTPEVSYAKLVARFVPVWVSPDSRSIVAKLLAAFQGDTSAELAL